jgi:NodT family efflux transporter outer membrane factor (OMF) lipoprotein
MRKQAWLALMIGLASSCAVGPKYVPRTPEDLNVPAAWHAALPENAKIGDLSRWWRQLGDPLLSEFIEEALKSSPTMDSARARLREARAQRKVAAADLYPTVNANGSGRTSKTGDEESVSAYQAGFDASWEPDIFGGTRRSLEASTAEFESMVANLQDAQVSLAAEVALEYVSVRSLQARIAIAQENLALQVETREIAGWRFQAGLVSGLDYDQARAAEAQTRAQIPALETSLADSRSRIAVLLGTAPGSADEMLAVQAPIPAVPESVIVGIPADVLRQRPDIRAAERTLAAQTARVGVAMASQYPNLSLSGSLGVEGVTLAALTGGASVIRSLAASVAETIFAGGRIRQQIRVQTAVQEQALAAYESTVLTALEDVENALVSLRRNRERYTHLQAADEAARSAAQFARQRYAAGLVDYTSIVSTQQTQLTVSDSLQSCEADITTALIQLYKALGGGWSTEDPASGSASTEGTIR